MAADLAGGQIGPEASWSVKFEAGKLVAAANYGGTELSAGLVLNLDAVLVLNALVDKLEEVVPGDQKALAEMLKSAIALLKPVVAAPAEPPVV
jgi:hypothetical protein